MKITAVVLTYYKERLGNVYRIIEDLKNSSRPPDKIIVFNNNPAVQFQCEGAIIINSSENFWTRSKYIICLLEPSDFYILIDDDITVRKTAIAHLISLIPQDNAAFCTSSEGLIEDPRTYTRGQFIREREIEIPTEVTWFCGSLVFASFASLIKMLEIEIKVRLAQKQYTCECDDVLVALANSPIFIYPARGDDLCENIDQMGVSLGEKFKGYSKMRYDFCIKAMEILKRYA